MLVFCISLDGARAAQGQICEVVLLVFAVISKYFIYGILGEWGVEMEVLVV